MISSAAHPTMSKMAATAGIVNLVPIDYLTNALVDWSS
jgi:hypothetical protein